MVESLADQIMRKVKQTTEIYHRLMLVIAPAGAGKTTALQNVQIRTTLSKIANQRGYTPQRIIWTSSVITLSSRVGLDL